MDTLNQPRNHTPQPAGSVLILSLWILALLALLAVSVSYRARIELQLSRYPWDEIRLTQIAKAAVSDASSTWRHPGISYTAMNQAWHQSDSWKGHVLPDGSYSIQHDQDYGLEDESARINLNAASPEVLKKLFASNTAVVPAIIAWRTPNGKSIDSQYDGLAYTARHGPFKSVEELRLVRGMTPDLYHSVEPYLTVYGEGQVNINTAPAGVLEAMGLNTVLVNKILLYRCGPDGVAGTGDDGVFTSVDSILPILSKRFYLREQESRSLAQSLQQGAWTVQSNCVRLNILARLTDGRTSRRFLAIATTRTAPAHLLFWREFAR